mmetsp:Transcript_67206/g.106814  ORF Transcript_67206/g.106814 Transcript_67206/m.106814 type:complete len:204 (+) Transcript_67206:165-776(+)
MRQCLIIPLHGPRRSISIHDALEEVAISGTRRAAIWQNIRPAASITPSSKRPRERVTLQRKWIFVFLRQITIPWNGALVAFEIVVSEQLVFDRDLDEIHGDVLRLPAERKGELFVVAQIRHIHDWSDLSSVAVSLMEPAYIRDGVRVVIDIQFGERAVADHVILQVVIRANHAGIVSAATGFANIQTSILIAVIVVGCKGASD